MLLLHPLLLYTLLIQYFESIPQYTLQVPISFHLEPPHPPIELIHHFDPNDIENAADMFHLEMVQDGMKWVPAMYTEEWIQNIVSVVYKEAKDEVITLYYKCSECGAVK